MVEIDGAGTMVVVFGAGMVEVDGAGTVVVVLGAGVVKVAQWCWELVWWRLMELAQWWLCSELKGQ
ncbi:Hypothetical protein SMAX5B_016924 [Scophthalmus maximus]|uniref:Uncharacterized protein n=1 Tax=Scophthalmus maximus TaxID=52904 RepID=A0A2U9CLP1_SCOMX|nr:Hypothetical protein SMAX5B_016924 [Scophthalmus maximus]